MKDSCSGVFDGDPQSGILQLIRGFSFVWRVKLHPVSDFFSSVNLFSSLNDPHLFVFYFRLKL